MGFTCILLTNTVLGGCYWDFKIIQICVRLCTFDGKRNQYILFGLIELISRRWPLLGL